ncbi:MAG: S24/S26 family peptidase [Lachnospiraceae bacterium]|nr:S24/S26 family peptidase [Lachnospiraceae bacterium]
MIGTDEFWGTVLRLVNEGKITKIKPTGISMVPFIMGDRDLVEIKSAEPLLKRGDIVLFRRDNGHYVLHRIFKVRGDEYYLLGDSQKDVEGPIKREQIVAQSRFYYKNGKRKDNDAFFMKIKYTLWFWLRPIRWPLIKINSFKRKLMGKE